MIFRRKKRRGPVSLDEFVGDGEGRSADLFDVSAGAKHWQAKLASMGKKPPGRLDLALSAFSLIRGGDLFERPNKKKSRTDPELIETYKKENLIIEANVDRAVRDAAVDGVLRVLSGNPAVCRRMLLAKRMRLVVVPKDRDFADCGFPRHTNPNAAGIFWNHPKEELAMLGLREEYVLDRPHLMVHEMTHAVHFLALTKNERDLIDKTLLPVYRNRTWVEEAVAIYAEKAFGADYTEDELNAPGLYGKTRRDWRPRHVFALFMEELLAPPPQQAVERARRGLQ